MIKAPYNFVPLNKDEHVIFPHWAEHISHDIPFQDEQSGTLRVRLEAHSPIMVADGVKDKNENTVLEFTKKPNGEYFIPGSSLRGMIRNVLEIMTFSKLGNKVADSRYAVRDLSGAMKNEYLQHFKPDKIMAGWLSLSESGDYFIEDCGQPGRISHRKLDEQLGTDFSTYFQDRRNGGRFDQRKDAQKAARFKYDRFENTKKGYEHSFNNTYADDPRPIYEFGHERTGTLVFTGQPGPRKLGRNGRWTGHHLEFIFFDAERTLKVDEQVMENFKFAYYEHDENQWSVDWKYWRKQLNKHQRIPVFFSKDEEGNVKHLGLSYLYKLPYNRSIKEAIEEYQDLRGIDFSEALFGYVNEDDKSTLKGRVQVAHTDFSENTTPIQGYKSEVLATPKASYFPNYIRQEVNENGSVNRYASLMDDAPEVAGWKRYPVHRNGVKENPSPNENQNITTKFRPLQEEAIFKFDIHYHNLKKIELGALISAITFHQDDQTFHSLGMAKSLGYGKVKLSIIDGIKGEQELEILKNFEAYMTAELGVNWNRQPQIIELFTMAREQENKGASELAYMELREFVAAKNNRQGLKKYSELVGAYAVHTLIEEADVEQMKDHIQQERAQYNNKQSPEVLLEHYQRQTKQQLQEALAKKKAEWLAQLATKREELEQAQAIQKREAKKAAAQAEGFDFSQIDPTNRNAFADLSKALKNIYLPRYHGVNNYKKLDTQTLEGLMPTHEHAQLLELLSTIYANSSKREQKRWHKEFGKNPVFRSISEWVGKERAEALWKGLT